MSRSLLIRVILLFFSIALVVLLGLYYHPYGYLLHSIDPIFDEIVENQKRTVLTSPVNYSILSDDYYVIAKNHVLSSSNEPPCYNLSTGYVNYVACTSNRDIMFGVYGKQGIGHLPQQRETLIRLLQATPGAALIDLGANIGLMAFPVLNTVGHDRKVIAVELSSENIRALSTGFKKNRIPAKFYKIIQRAITDTVDEQVSIEIVRIRSNISTLAVVNGKVRDDTAREHDVGHQPVFIEKVRTATMDSHILPVARAMNITVAIMKLDIEGCECLAVQKAQKFFENIYVPYIYFEQHLDYMKPDCVKEMHGILKKLNYVPFRWGTTGLGGRQKSFLMGRFREMILKKIP